MHRSMQKQVLHRKTFDMQVLHLFTANLYA